MILLALLLGCHAAAPGTTTPPTDGLGSPTDPTTLGTDAATQPTLGTSTTSEPTDTAPPEDTANGTVPALVGVGYGGLRVVSRDGGVTWGDRAAFAAAGLDDENLLRAVTWGAGLWIATGWKFVTSTDGVTWTDHGKIADDPALPDCNIVEGLAYGLGAYWAACADWTGSGQMYRSDDGFTWTVASTIGQTEGHLFLAYQGGAFVAYGDTGASFTSTDGLTWTDLGLTRATWCDGAWRDQATCHDASWFDGAYFSTQWPDVIRRSTNGTDWTQVYQDPEQNSLYQPRAIAAGRVPGP